MIQKGSRGELISVAQVRAARGLLGWSQADLASAASVSVPSIKRLEGQGAIKVSNDLWLAVCWAFEREGVEFIEANGGGVGVRLKRAKPLPR